MSGDTWEVVGGEAVGGIIVSGGRDLNSPQDEFKLATGSLVKQMKLVGSRLYFWKIAGFGPEYGWVNVSDLERTDKMPWDYVPSQAVTDMTALDDGKSPALCDIVAGAYSHFHQVAFQETKASGLRMSGCLNAMDELRDGMYDVVDTSINSMSNARDPIIEAAIELLPSINIMNNDDDGLLYTHPDSTGPVLSWLRCEAKLGWPGTSLKSEKQTCYLLGKKRNGPLKKTPIANAHFVQAFCGTNNIDMVPLQGADWEQDFNRFWALPKRKFSSQYLDSPKLATMYPSRKPFKPDHCKKITWLLPQHYGDAWATFNHVKAPELLWDMNMLVGGAFKALLEPEPDPQAIAMNMPGAMQSGKFYDVLCYLESSAKKAVYAFFPKDQLSDKSCVFAVCAIYNWTDLKGDGKTLSVEDLTMIDTEGRSALLSFHKGTKATWPSCVDFSAAGFAR